MTVLPEPYESALKDGVYTVSSTSYDPFGYGLVYRMEVVDGIITDVSLKQYGMDGLERLSSNSRLMWSGCEESLNQILQDAYASIIQRQEPEIDEVTGATQTYENMSILAQKAFENALEGEPASLGVDDFTWTYSATNALDPYNESQEILKVTYIGDEIASVECRELKSTTDLYTIGRIYSSFAQETEEAGTLSEIVSPEYPRFAQRYNELLNQIRQQRQSFTAPRN